MTYRSLFILIWLASSLVFLAFSGWLQLNGFISEEVMQLWSKAILQVDGPASYKTSDAVYPPLPLFLTIMLQYFPVWNALPTPIVLASGLAGLLATLWYFSLVIEADYSRLHAFLLTALMCSNPLFVLLLSSGPEMMLLCVGIWIYGRALVFLRLTGSISEMMKVAVGLLIACLSSSYGILFAFGALPFLAIAARPSMLVDAPVGYLIVISFPILCAIGSLFFVSSIFDTPLISQTFLFSARPDAHLAGVAFLVLGLPTWCVAWVMRHHSAYVLPLLCSAFTLGAAMLLNLEYKLAAGHLVSAAPLLPLTVVALQFWPKVRGRLTATCAVQTLCWATAASILFLSDDDKVSTLRSVMIDQTTWHAGDANKVAGFLHDLDDVLLDAERNPELVVTLKTVKGLVLAGAADYELTLMGGTPRQTYIVVRKNLNSLFIRDRVTRRFPDPFSRSLPGYKIVFEAGEWSVLAKQIS